MHIDPELTDAFNALISGEKWWVSLPKDLYEFRDELTCDPQCSEPFDNFHRQTGVWFIHVLPQIRYVLYSGTQELVGGEALRHMLHLISEADFRNFLRMRAFFLY